MRRIVSFWDVLPLYETNRYLTTYVIVSILLMRGGMQLLSKPNTNRVESARVFCFDSSARGAVHGDMFDS